MKKTILLLCIGLFCFCKNGFAQQIRAGAAMVNITPSYGTIINGDFLPMYAKTIHDSLYAKALVLDNGKHRFAFVVVDCMGMDEELMNDAKQIILSKIKLSPKQVMISTTHAHSCGAVHGGAACPADLNYRLSLPEKMAAAVINAVNKLQPAKISWGSADVPQHPSCRRWFMKDGFPMISPFGDTDKVWMNPPLGSPYLDKPAAPTDPEFSFLAVKSLKDEWISVLGNYSIHYAADIPEHTISADYFGEFHWQLKKELNAPEGFVGIMSNGTSGDVNTYDFKKERNYPTEFYAKSKLIAKDLVATFYTASANLKWQTTPVFKSDYATVKVNSRIPSDELVKKSKQTVQSTNYRNLNTIDKASDAIARLYALDIVELNAYQKPYYNLPVQAIRIGNGIIGTLPAEIFSYTGLRLKSEINNKNYFTIGLANFRENYIPPAHEFELGGYETWLCAGSRMEKGAEEKLRSLLLSLVKRMLQ